MNKHFLLKVCRMQVIDLFFRDKGFSRSFIHEKLIYPHHFICKKTYYNYLGVNAKRILKEKYNIDWKNELSKHTPIDYMALMGEFTPLEVKKEEKQVAEQYTQLVIEGCK